MDMMQLDKLAPHVPKPPALHCAGGFGAAEGAVEGAVEGAGDGVGDAVTLSTSSLSSCAASIAVGAQGGMRQYACVG